MTAFPTTENVFCHFWWEKHYHKGSLYVYNNLQCRGEYEGHFPLHANDMIEMDIPQLAGATLHVRIKEIGDGFFTGILLHKPRGGEEGT